MIMGDGLWVGAIGMAFGGGTAVAERPFDFTELFFVAGPPGGASSMFTSFVALVLAIQAPQSKPQTPPERGTEKGGQSRRAKTDVTAATPEQAVRNFIIAMSTKDEATLRAVTLPTDDFDWLLQGQAVPADQVEEFKAQIARMPIRVLKPREQITLPGDRRITVQPEEVTADRAVLLPQGAAFPVRCRKADGCWSVDATTIIAGIKPAEAARKTIDPSTLKDKVTISLGKKLAVQFEQKGNALSHPKVVKEPTKTPPTILIDFEKNDENLMLTTQNPFPKDLKFRALARLKGRKNYFETSIVPVMAGIFSAELWNEPIEELVLFDFKLTNSPPKARNP